MHYIYEMYMTYLEKKAIQFICWQLHKVLGFITWFFMDVVLALMTCQQQKV